MRKKALLFVGLIVAFANFSLSSSLSEDLKIEVMEKRIRDFSLEGLTLVFYVNIANSSSKTYYLSGYDYRFIINHKDYLQLQTELEEGLKIEARDETLVAFPVKVTYANLFRTIPEMRDELHAACNLVGWVRFSDGRRERGKVALGFTGDFPIFWEPELEFVELRVSTLTIGGADLNFVVKFKNKNRFDLIVDRISYALALAGYTIDEGTIDGDKSIEKQGEKVFSLPLLLNFYEVGKEVFDVLDKSSTQCSFTGVVEVQTVWGRLSIPFEEQGLLAITRLP
jgi:LEA14-like dessication related protein